MSRRAALVTLFTLSCTATPQPVNPGGPAVCTDGPRNPTARVERDVAVTGVTVQSMRRDGDEIFVVESGDNTVSRFDINEQSYELLVDVGDDRGPWDVWIGEDELWITNNLADSVTVADRETGEVLVEIEDESLQSPAGITGLDGRVYVGNTQFRDVGSYGPGSVTVIDRESREVRGTLPTKRQNPQSLATIGDRVVIVSSGIFDFDGSRYVAGSEGAVEVWSPTADALIPETSVAVIPLRDDRSIGLPGYPAHQDGSSIIYLPSATAPVLFSIDLASMQWRRGSDDPIWLYETDQNALHHAAMGDDGVLFVTSFNEDALYLVDTSCNTVLDEIELEHSSMLAGPHGVVPVGDDAYFALAHAFEIGRVELDFGDDDE